MSLPFRALFLENPPNVPIIDVILPVYNESGLVATVFPQIRAFAQEHGQFRFLFVDDGSTDDSARRIEKHIADSGMSDRLRLHRCQTNGGKGMAIHTGFSLAEGDLLIFTDGDLAYSLDHLLLLADALRLNDVVIGSRSLVESGQKNIKLSRKIMGWTFNRFVRLILHLPYSDTQAGLKGFRKEAARNIFRRQHLFDFAFDVELVYLARKLGYRIGEVAARVSESHSYKISTVNMARDPMRMFIALWKVRINSWRNVYGLRGKR